MGKKICILVDSGCDVPQAVRQDYDMRVLPLKIRYPEGEYDDQVNITAQQVYDRFPGEIPQTSLPDGGTIHDALDRARADGYEKALVICISSGLSGTYNMVRLVCQEYQGMETFVLDTRNISFGSGVLCPVGRPLDRRGHGLAGSANPVGPEAGRQQGIFSAWTPWNTCVRVGGWGWWQPLWERP